MTRTSLTHPLQIASVVPAAGYGALGITFCPGKHQSSAATGIWQRDLGLDLDAVRDWGAVAVVTLLEPHEIATLKVDALGREIVARHMEWLHLPIPDGGTPDSRFEARWVTAGEGLRARLRDGFSVLVHCKGGLGRAGLVAARLLIELGWSPASAIQAVREVRPGAIETMAQEQFVEALAAVPEARPASSVVAVGDRAAGALLGLAVGDAVGTTLEFTGRDRSPPLTDMVGGGPFRLKIGEWTDDTAMALALAESLVAHPQFDARDLMVRFVEWYREGAYSCTGTCFDIGITTRQALTRFERSGDPIAGDTDPATAGNGSLMRLAPAAIRYCREADRRAAVAAQQSRTTHGAPQAVAACVTFADLLAEAITGSPRSEVLAPRGGIEEATIAAIMAGSWRGKARAAVSSSGYVAHSLEAALWCLGRTASFREAVLLAANLGDDADTTAAITGQLAGALYGASAIPSEWLAHLAWRDRIEALAAALVR